MLQVFSVVGHFLGSDCNILLFQDCLRAVNFNSYLI